MDLFSRDIKQLEPFLPLIFPLLIVGGVFSFFYFDARKKKEALAKLGLRFQGAVGGFFNQSFRGTYAGVAFTLTLIPAGKNSPPYLTVELFKAMPFALQVTTENALTRFGKNLGLLREVSVHALSFDERFFIRSDDEQQAASFLGRAEAREAVTALFDAGFEALDFNKKRLYVRKPNYAFPGDLAAGRVEEILRHLLDLR